MSASYDNPGGRPPDGGHDPLRYATDPATGSPQSPAHPGHGGSGHGTHPHATAPEDYAQTYAAAGHDPYGGGDTTYAPDPYGEPTQRTRPEIAAPRGDLFAPTRPTKRSTEQFNAPIVQAGSVTGRSLNLVITIMCFLACLTAGAVYMINQSADAWLRDIASEITVQIEPKDKVDTEKTISDVRSFLEQQTGIRKVTPLAVEDSAELLEPWLGKADILKTLPVPRLIAIEVDRTSPPDLARIKGELESRFAGTSLDDHRRWQRQIRTVTRSLALGGLAILLLVGAATTAIIISAARSSMASNREIVEVLHFVGATDRFIAREFEKHFLRLGIRAGIVGAVLAMAIFFLMPTIMQLMGGGSMALSEMQQLIGTGALDLAGYLLLGIVVVVVAALCMLTSRLGVFRILKGKH